MLLMTSINGQAVYRPLAELATIRTGMRPTDSDLASGGTIPYFNGGVQATGYVANPNSDGNTITIPSRGSVGIVSFQSSPYWCGPLCYRLDIMAPELLPKYLFYALKSIEPAIVRLQQTGSIPALNKKELERVRIPIPEIRTQREIVNTLEQFEGLDSLLKLEMVARTRQYEYWRDASMRELANMSSLPATAVSSVRLGDVSTVRRGIQLRDADGDRSGYPVVTASRTETKTHSQFNYPAGSVTVTSHGAYAGHVNFWSSPIWLANNVFLLEPSDRLDPLFFYFAVKWLEPSIHSLAQGGGVPYINARDLAPLKIPMPPLSKQIELARKLELLVSLTTSLEQELAARRKQYEYYRDKLLTFKELKS
jgi:type I restriction enzyme S subunit